MPVVEQKGECRSFGETVDFLLVDAEARRHPEARAPVSGDLTAEAVDGGDVRRLEPPELFGDEGIVAILAEAAKNPFVHLRGGLSGEREREDAVDRHLLVEHQTQVSLRQHARLSGTGSCGHDGISA